MKIVVLWLNHIFELLPLPLLEVWGRFSFLIGFVIMLAAFSGFTFRPLGYWGIGRQRQIWDSRALLSFVVTFILVIIAGYSGSNVVIVANAQTFESLKDLAVFICIALFGYPALLAVPIAYGVSDIIEGVPPSYILDWFAGYLINPALFWLGFLYLGRDPDFRKKKTWKAYLRFVLIFTFLEPILWGYICISKFPPEISYREVSPALMFTTMITWCMAPIVMMVVYPIVKKLGLFWADIPDHVEERSLRRPDVVWISGHGRRPIEAARQGVPIRMFIATPIIIFVLIMVGTTAYVTLKSAENEATRMAGQLHKELADNLNTQIEQFLQGSDALDEISLRAGLNGLLKHQVIAGNGRAFILDPLGEIIASSSDNTGQPKVAESIQKLFMKQPQLGPKFAPSQSHFDVVTVQPLKRETWLTQATPYEDKNGGQYKWILMTAIPESFYLSGVRTGSSQSAMVFALFLILSLLIASLLAKRMSDPIYQLALATDSIARGKLDQYIPHSRLEEVNMLAKSFNHMSRELCHAYDDLNAAKEVAESSSKLKSEFLDIAAHELRTPMTPMFLLVQVMQEDIAKGKPVAPEYISQIAKHMKRLMGLADELLNLSRLERGSINLNVLRGNLAELVNETLEEFKRLAPAREFHGLGLEEPCFAMYDATRIHQVLYNLLENALKYTPKNTPIEVRLTKAGRKLRVSVIDHGKGVKTEEEPYLFDKFYRAQADVKSKQQGLGLGLYICRKIIELHGGTIQVRRTEPHGCTFQFEIPGEKENTHA